MGRRGYDDRLKRKWQRKLDKQDEDKRWEATEERERVLEQLAEDDEPQDMDDFTSRMDAALKNFYGSGNRAVKIANGQISPLLAWLRKHRGPR